MIPSIMVCIRMTALLYALAKVSASVRVEQPTGHLGALIQTRAPPENFSSEWLRIGVCNEKGCMMTPHGTGYPVPVVVDRKPRAKWSTHSIMRVDYIETRRLCDRLSVRNGSGHVR